MRINFVLERFGIVVRGYLDDATGRVGFYNPEGEDAGGEYPSNPFDKDVNPVDYRHFESIKDSFYIDLEHNDLRGIIKRERGAVNRIFYSIVIGVE